MIQIIDFRLDSLSKLVRNRSNFIITAGCLLFVIFGACSRVESPSDRRAATRETDMAEATEEPKHLKQRLPDQKSNGRMTEGEPLVLSDPTSFYAAPLIELPEVPEVSYTEFNVGREAFIQTLLAADGDLVADLILVTVKAFITPEQLHRAKLIGMESTPKLKELRRQYYQILEQAGTETCSANVVEEKLSALRVQVHFHLSEIRKRIFKEVLTRTQFQQIKQQSDDRKALQETANQNQPAADNK